MGSCTLPLCLCHTLPRGSATPCTAGYGTNCYQILRFGTSMLTPIYAFGTNCYQILTYAIHHANTHPCICWTCQFPFDHWSKAATGPVSTRHVPRSQKDPRSWISRIKDPGSCRILEPTFSFSHGILKILDLNGFLYRDPGDLWSCGYWILDFYVIVGSRRSWIFIFLFLRWDPGDSGPETFAWSWDPGDLWSCLSDFAMGSCRSWILTFHFVVRSCVSWILIFKRGTCLHRARLLKLSRYGYIIQDLLNSLINSDRLTTEGCITYLSRVQGAVGGEVRGAR